MDFDNFLQGLKQRLTDDRFRVAENVVLPDGRVVELVASRRRWYSFARSQYLLVAARDNPTEYDASILLLAGFQYAKEKNRLPAWLAPYEIISCVVTRNTDEKLRHRMTSSPDSGEMSLQAVFDLDTGKAYHPAISSASKWPNLQYLVAKYIENKPLGKKQKLRRWFKQWPYWMEAFRNLVPLPCAMLLLLSDLNTTLSLILISIKRTLQARWNAEDIKLFGQPLEPR